MYGKPLVSSMRECENGYTSNRAHGGCSKLKRGDTLKKHKNMQ
jgi:hypothetical protein